MSAAASLSSNAPLSPLRAAGNTSSASQDLSFMDVLHGSSCRPATPAAKVAGTRGDQSAPRRKLSPQAGRAIEMLGHAIDYLADEFALECRTREAATARKHGCVQAIELLMARNREIYLSCPALPTLAERLRSFLHLQRA